MKQKVKNREINGKYYIEKLRIKITFSIPQTSMISCFNHNTMFESKGQE